MSVLKPGVGATFAGVLTVTGAAFIGDTANAFNTAGLTLNQAAADDEIVSLKSSDVAHGVTDFAETDTYGSMGKASDTNGGLLVRGLSEVETGILAQGFVTTDSGTRSTAGTGAIHLTAHLKSGTGIANMAADKNMVVIRNNATTRFIFDSDGDSHQDVGTAWTNF